MGRVGEQEVGRDRTGDERIGRGSTGSTAGTGGKP